jgi:ATP-dependent DNA helicase PIF1
MSFFHIYPAHLSKKIGLWSGPFDMLRLHPFLYQAIFVNKRNCFLTGPSGCGKSYAIRMIKQIADHYKIICAVTSTTGVSAHDIGGTTIHRWSSIKLADKPLDIILTYIRSEPQRMKRWTDTQLLIIDEISMLDSKVLNLLNDLANILRQKKSLLFSSDQTVFGNLQLCFTGDFLQLPPVSGTYAFKSKVWKELNFFNYRMINPYRYPDLEYFQMILRLRQGKPSKEDIKDLNECKKSYKLYQEAEKRGEVPLVLPTRIYSLKQDVEKLNLVELYKLPSDINLYEADDSITIKTDKKGKLVVDPRKINREEYMKYMDTIVSPTLPLKNGAQVMLTKNLDVESGLTNGARGIVIDCDQEHVIVRFLNGLEILIVPQAYEHEDEKIKIVRIQIPLILAWAISIHKSQGSSIDTAIGDCGTTIFSSSMAFVLISRVKTLRGLKLVNFMPSKIYCDKEALDFENDLVKNCVNCPIVKF